MSSNGFVRCSTCRSSSCCPRTASRWIARRSSGCFPERRPLRRCPQEKARPSGPELDVREAGEELHQPVAGVVVDRAVVDDLVAQLPDRPFRPRPAREARDDRAAGRNQLAHPADVGGRVLDVIEVAEREDYLLRARDADSEEVTLDQHQLLGIEALESLPREIEHRVGEVDVDVARRALLQDQLADPRRAAADVEDPRRLVLACDLERELTAVEETGPERALERVLLVVEAVKR